MVLQAGSGAGPHVRLTNPTQNGAMTMPAVTQSQNQYRKCMRHKQVGSQSKWESKCKWRFGRDGQYSTQDRT